MAYFLNTEDTQKLFNLPSMVKFPIQIEYFKEGERRKLFHFQDKADYLEQRESNPIVKENIKLSGIDY
jgi:hypothetical protein